jgi:hypothetical protein
MGDESTGFLGNATLNIIGIVISTVLPLLLLRYFRNQEKKQLEKQKEQRQALDMNTKKLEDLAKESTREQKEQTQKMIESLEGRHSKTLHEMEENYSKIQHKMLDDLKHEKEVAHKEMAADFRKHMLDMVTELKNEDKRIVDDIRKEGLIRDQRLLDELQRLVDLKNNEVIIKVNAMADSLKETNTKIRRVGEEVEELGQKQKDMRANQEIMIVSLQKRADMTNGNVAAIRKDIVEIQEDMDEIHDKVSGNGRQPSEKRVRKRQRNQKRHEIAQNEFSDDMDHTMPTPY